MLPGLRVIGKLLLPIIVLAAQSTAYASYDYAVGIARDQIGDQYELGYEGPDIFDCSGLTQYAYRHVGIELPRATNCDTQPDGTCTIAQVDVGQAVVGELQPGDLIFFDATKTPSGFATHVGIYEGENKFIHANWVTWPVERIDLNTGEHFWSGVLWKDRIIATRRLPPPPGPSTTFATRDIVEATEDGANIRDAAADWNPVKVAGENATTSAGVKGRVMSLPMYFIGHWFWEVDFESGADGWVAETFLWKEGVPLQETALIGVVPGTFTTDGGSFEISVSPKDAEGNLITSGVTESNFEFANISVAVATAPDTEISGGSAETTGVEAILPEAGEPATLVLTFDGSGSMLSNDPDRLRVVAGKQFVGLLGDDDRAAVTDFGLGSTAGQRVSRLLQDFTSDKVLLDASIDQLTAALSFRGTPLYDSLLDSLDLLGAILAPNPAVVVLTDGEENTSVSTLFDVVNLANTQGIPLFTVGLGGGIGFAQLQTLAGDTGGVFAEVSDADALGIVFENISFGLVEGRVVVTGQGTFVPPLQQAGEYIVSGELVTTIGGTSIGTPFSFPVDVVAAGSVTGVSRVLFDYRIPYTAEEERQRALEFMYRENITE